MTALHTAPVRRSVEPKTALSVRRLNIMRVGYAVMGIGLVAVKWPMLPDVRSLPLFEGVVLCILVAMSLLALLGLRYPVRMLPVLLFESAWKMLWLLVVALPTAVSGDVGNEMAELIASCSFVVIVLAVVPWRYVWTQYAAQGDPWR
jgi:hypothetical protein